MSGSCGFLSLSEQTAARFVAHGGICVVKASTLVPPPPPAITPKEPVGHDVPYIRRY
jgi:hypothetical protein